MGLIIMKGPPSQGGSHHFPYGSIVFRCIWLPCSQELIGSPIKWAPDPVMSRVTTPLTGVITPVTVPIYKAAPCPSI